jgi:hypothetical protein
MIQLLRLNLLKKKGSYSSEGYFVPLEHAFKVFVRVTCLI